MQALKYKNSKSQKHKDNSRSLFIIFGASKGLGRALYEYSSQFDQNDFILVNRQATKIKFAQTNEIIIDLSEIIKSQNLSKLFNFINNKKNYKNIYLINNASVIQPIKPIGRVSSSDLTSSVHVNFLNYIIIINEFIKKTHKLKSNKKILNITSGAASSPQHGLAAYCSTKAALEMFGQCIFKEQQKLKQIKILNFRPGVIDTNMQKKMRSSHKNDFLKTDLYKELFQKNELLPPEYVAKKIYQILNNDKYWQKPILDIININ